MSSNTSHYIFSWCDRELLAMQSFGLIQCVVLLTDVLYLQQNTSSQTTKPTSPSPGQQSCCLLSLLFSSHVLVDVAAAAAAAAVAAVVVAVDDDVRFLPLVLFCTLRGQRSDLICFNPTYFWKCVYGLFEVHTSNPSSQVLITPPDVWWMLPLGASLSLSLSLSCSLPLSPPLLSFSSLSRSYSSPPDTKPCLIHLSSPVSPRPNHLRSHFIFYFPFFCSPSVLHLLYYFSLFMFCLCPCLRPSSRTLSAFTHMHTYNTISHTHTHAL